MMSCSGFSINARLSDAREAACVTLRQTAILNSHQFWEINHQLLSICKVYINVETEYVRDFLRRGEGNPDEVVSHDLSNVASPRH